MRRVRDELLPRGVELRELDAHAFERRRELTELVVALVHDRLIEPALRDPVRRALEAPDAPRVQRRRHAPEDRRDRERHACRVQQAALHDPDGRELVLDRSGEQEHVPRREQRYRDLAVRTAAALHAAARDPRAVRGLQRDRVVRDGQARGARVGKRAQRERRWAEHLVDDRTRVVEERG